MRLEKQGTATKLIECVSFVSSQVIFCQKHWKTLFFWVKILRNVLVLQVKFIQGFPFWF